MLATTVQGQEYQPRHVVPRDGGAWARLWTWEENTGCELPLFPVWVLSLILWPFHRVCERLYILPFNSSKLRLVRTLQVRAVTGTDRGMSEWGGQARAVAALRDRRLSTNIWLKGNGKTRTPVWVLPLQILGDYFIRGQLFCPPPIYNLCSIIKQRPAEHLF